MTVTRLFVFGSNLAGRHGRGAALAAARWHGAVLGVGEGRTGNAYAIPTKDAALAILPFDRIRAAVDRFKDYAAQHADCQFEVTRVGCGLAGYSDAAIAPLFDNAPPNCILPYVWQMRVKAAPARIIVAGSRSFADYTLLDSRLGHLISKLSVPPVIVSGGARGADRMGERYAKERDLQVIRVLAEWDRFGRAAGMLRNQRMAWSANKLVAFWDGSSPGTRNMIATAHAGGLDVRVVSIEAAAHVA